ncbi:MAG TPA: response regulator, partial [Blastocatellia bacterium]|nr:response regulator [Blastocatellia bacterium]
MQHTILAVDDEPANLRMVERLLRKDHRVLTAGGGEEALEILKREQVSLIVTDQRMPG